MPVSQAQRGAMYAAAQRRAVLKTHSSFFFQMKNAVHGIPSVVSAKQTCVGYSVFSTEIGALKSWFFPSLSWPAMWIKPSPSIL